MSQRTPPPLSIPVAVLAAGSSSRMGAHKLLLDLSGRPLVAWSVMSAEASRAGEILVILGRDAGAVAAALPAGRHTNIVNDNAVRGQSTSLARAVTSISPDAPGFIVVLADQPFMDARSIDAALDAARLSPEIVVMGVTASGAGHPVYLPRRLFPRIVALTGDMGARDIIAAERDSIIRVPLDNPYAQFDVDSPEDYARAVELARSMLPAS